MDVSVGLTKGVSLALKVQENTTVKEVYEALGVLGCHNVELLSDGFMLADDACVPAAVSIRKKVQLSKVTATKSMTRSSTLRARRTPSTPTVATPTKNDRKEKAFERPKSTPVKDKCTEKKKEEKKEADKRKEIEKKEPEKKKKVVKAENGKPIRESNKQSTYAAIAGDLDDIRARVAKVTAVDIRKIAAIASPNPIVVSLMEHVMLALGLTHKSWDATASELSDIQFLKKLCNAEPNFPDRSLRRLETYMFPTPEELKKVAGPASVIMMAWLQAMIASAKSKEKEAKEKESTNEKESIHKASKETSFSRSKSSITSITPDTQALDAAADELSSLKNSDFREFRTVGKDKPPALVVPLAAMQAALGRKDTSIEAALKMIINPSTFVKLLIDAARDPKRYLKLDKSEFLILQKFINNAGMNQELKSSLVALPPIVNWVKAAYAYAQAFHKEKLKVSSDDPAKKGTEHHDPKKITGDGASPKSKPSSPLPERAEQVAELESEIKAEVKEEAKEETTSKEHNEVPQEEEVVEEKTEEPEVEEKKEQEIAEPTLEEQPEKAAAEEEPAEPKQAEEAKEEETQAECENPEAKQWGNNESFDDEY
eukprot:TRINITY_DN10877_c0_g1_i1.p1 TRINITY_DN10877_c0_g1~~TRINITY_DN10877_c0_g1_i1.p1  ORF type:complete len:599 (+),score=168.67 TRINITY_DN10877_c0_g1_i1:40-1836(+)